MREWGRMSARVIFNAKKKRIINPSLDVPNVWKATTHLLPSAFVITVVTYISSMAIGTRFADQFHYKVMNRGRMRERKREGRNEEERKEN
jgi:hypothetical protein